MTANDGKLQGVALITGAASGIGRATALIFVKEGCTRLVLGDLDVNGLSTVSDELKRLNPAVKVVSVKVDVSSEEQVINLVQTAVKEFGEIHYAVNNAGITNDKRVRTDELPTSSWDRVVSINLRGVWLCQRAQLQQMLKQPANLATRTGAPPQRGSIINISSIFGLLSHPTVGGYAASKAGVLGITRTDAIGYGGDGIRVNAVCPGFIKTPLIEQSIRRGANYDEISRSVPVGRLGTPEEIGEAIVFLASEKASLVNGVELVVDGGYSKL
ncbi:short chain dehydrogenase/ reductase [Aspergillus ambiguus]|uniref:SDR family NAD(P)-dependent oxidoreductase n=1 Tax=Aspergillus ambiguus TaxID=176160 RepID=UPI003CCE5233